MKYNGMILTVILFFTSACSTIPEKDFNYQVKNGKCEEAVKNVPDSSLSSLFKSTKNITGTAASYVLTGLTYGSEVTFYVVGGITAGLAVCSPIIALEVSGKTSGSASTECFKVVTHGISSSEFGKGKYLGGKVYDKTSSWRCPDLSDFSKSLREIATCYEQKNDVENLEKARAQLDIIRNQDFQESCVDDEERAEILKQYEEIEKKILAKKKTAWN